MTPEQPPRPAPDPDCRYCAGRGEVVGGDEVRDCYCRGLVPTDLTEDTSAQRGQQDRERMEDRVDFEAKAFARHEIGLD